MMLCVSFDLWLLLVVAVALIHPSVADSSYIVVTRGGNVIGTSVTEGGRASDVASDTNYEISTASEQTDIGVAVGSGGGRRQSCANPPSVAGSHIQLAVERVPGGILLRVSYSCLKNLTLTGASVLTCGPHNDFTWRTEDVPSCEEGGQEAVGATPTPLPIVSDTTTTLQRSEAPRIECGAPLLVSNADVVTRSEDVAEYRCFEGYPATMAATNQSLSAHCNHNTGQWSQPLWECRELNCGPPPTPVNTTVRYRTTTVGSGALYLCQTGSSPPGTSDYATSTCQASGRWSSVNFTCKYVDCGPPIPQQHPGMNITYDSTHFGSKAFVRCVDGYNQESGTADALVVDIAELHTAVVVSMMCQTNGSWSELQTGCVPSICSAIPGVEGSAGSRQVVASSKSTVVFARAEYECNSGYTLVTGSERYCYWNNTWSTNEVICVREVACPSPPYIPSAQFEVFPAEAGLPVSVFYKCLPGNAGQGVATATCTRGMWGELTFSCSPVTCGSPPTFTHANVYYVDTEHDSHATYDCKTGFKGESSVWVCGLDGHWTGTVPVCEVSGCETPLPVLNSFLQITTGNLTTPYIPAMRLEYSKDYPVATSIRYKCANGLVLIGGAVRECQPSQVWSGRAPRCLSITCPRIATPANGNADVSGYGAGSTARFSCDSGYALQGHKQLQCGPGRWSGAIPHCTFAMPKVAVDAVLSRGQRKVRNATVHTYAGTNRAYLRCVAVNGEPQPTLTWERITGQKELDGKLRHQQTKSGELSLRIIFKPVKLSHAGMWRCSANNSHGEVHVDIQLFVYESCPPPPGITSGHFVSLLNSIAHPQSADTGTNRTKYFFNEQISYHCHRGHALVGTRIRTCQADGTWSGDTSACYRRNCGKPAVPMHGSIRGAMFRYGDPVEYSCKPGYRLLGSRTRRCLETGKWSGSAPSCRIVSCGPPVGRANTQMSGDKFVFGSVITAQCSAGYFDPQQASDSASLRCSEHGQWKGTPLNCTLIQCSAPPSPRSGHLYYSRLAQAKQPVPGASVFSYHDCIHYRCNAGYSLLGTASRCCTATGRWSGTAATCQAWCDAADCSRGEKCVADLRSGRARCVCMDEERDCARRAGRPVCGSDDVTYASLCSMHTMACHHGNTSVYVGWSGSCDSLYESQRHCQCQVQVRQPMLLDCFRSSWTMLVRVVAAQNLSYRVYVHKVYRMGRKTLEDSRMYKLTRVGDMNDCRCPSLQVGLTYLLSGLEGHNKSEWHLIVSSYSYARQQVYPTDLASIQWPCT